MSPIFLLSIPITAALIGWFTNYIAIKMLFRPRNPVSILGLKFHGVVPRRQAQLAQSIAETVESELISHEDIRKFLEKSESHAAIDALLQEQIEIFLVQKLGSNPMVAMFLQGELGQQIKQSMLEQFRKAIPGLMQTLLDRLEEGMNFQEIIRQKIEAFELSKLEQIIYRISARELRTIELLGGVLGFFVGVVQIVIMMSTQG